jgi:hypothetical protein
MSEHALFLAQCIERVGKQFGEHVTNAIPGLSWHQWGEAADSAWVVDNEVVWSIEETVNGLNGYMVYADEAFDNRHFSCIISIGPILYCTHF